MRRHTIRIVAPLAAFVAALSCGGADGIAPPASTPITRQSDSMLIAGLYASGPVPSGYISRDRIVASGTAASRSAAASTEVSWVSLVPGAVADGTTATIINLHTAQRISVAIVDGGFDPQPIPASLGDTIEVAVDRTGKPQTAAVLSLAARPGPRIVRSRPPRGQTDAPLNTIITLVFSEPLDPVSVNASSVTLTTGGSPVAGAVRVLPETGYTVEFTPAALLAPATTYEFTVNGVRNAAGVSLPAPASIAFTTGTTTTPQPEYYPHEAVLGPQHLVTVTGDSAWMIGVVYRGTGVAPDTLEWTISDPSVASIETVDKNRIMVRALRTGTATIAARTNDSRPDLSASANIQVIGRSSAASPVIAEEFSILEYHSVDYRFFGYVPNLVLRDTSAAQASRVIGITIDLPGAAGPSLCYSDHVVGAGLWTVFPPPGDLNGIGLGRQDGQRLPDVTVDAVAHITVAQSDGLGMTFSVSGKILQSQPSTYFESGIYPPCL